MAKKRYLIAELFHDLPALEDEQERKERIEEVIDSIPDDRTRERFQEFLEEMYSV